jgi:hypothetical protein
MKVKTLSKLWSKIVSWHMIIEFNVIAYLQTYRMQKNLLKKIWNSNTLSKDENMHVD